MSISMGSLLSPIFMIVILVVPVHSLDSRKLDEATVPGTPESIKCTPCCTNPCGQAPPPPSPPSPPPPSPKKPPKSYCPPPPPPPSSFIYITGPPGNLYPVDPYFSGTGRLMVGLPVLLWCGLIGLFGFW